MDQNGNPDNSSFYAKSTAPGQNYGVVTGDNLQELTTIYPSVSPISGSSVAPLGIMPRSGFVNSYRFEWTILFSTRVNPTSAESFGMFIGGSVAATYNSSWSYTPYVSGTINFSAQGADGVAISPSASCYLGKYTAYITTKASMSGITGGNIPYIMPFFYFPTAGVASFNVVYNYIELITDYGTVLGTSTPWQCKPQFNPTIVSEPIYDYSTGVPVLVVEEKEEDFSYDTPHSSVSSTRRSLPREMSSLHIQPNYRR